MPDGLLGFFSRWKDRRAKTSIRHAEPMEISYIEGFSRGFELAMEMMPELQKEVREKVRQQAIDETLQRLKSGNKLQEDKT